MNDSREVLWRRAILAPVLVCAGIACAHLVAQPNTGLVTANFAGGCFWSMQKAFDHVPGVVATAAGYEGGNTKNPSYGQVETGRTGHAETVQVTYDPKRLSYAQLLNVYWHNIDPTTLNRQFCDRGPQYRSIIFYGSPAEQKLALQSRATIAAANRLHKPVVTEIRPSGAFYRAETYHQEYYQKNPLAYASYRNGCGQDRVLHDVWG